LVAVASRVEWEEIHPITIRCSLNGLEWAPVHVHLGP